MNKLLAILVDFNSFQSCNLPTGNINQPKQQQSMLCQTLTRWQMWAPSTFSAFSTSALRSTIAFYSIDSSMTTVSGDWPFSGSSLISRDTVNSCGTTGSPQRLYQPPPVCRRGSSWCRSSLSLTQLKSSPSFSIRVSKCKRLLTTYKHMDQLRTLLLT